MALPDLGQCQCCGIEPGIGVASSVLGPFSTVLGNACLAAGAEPWPMVQMILEQSGGAEGLATWVYVITTFKDGRYMLLKDALANEQAPSAHE